MASSAASGARGVGGSTVTTASMPRGAAAPPPGPRRRSLAAVVGLRARPARVVAGSDPAHRSSPPAGQLVDRGHEVAGRPASPASSRLPSAWPSRSPPLEAVLEGRRPASRRRRRPARRGSGGGRRAPACRAPRGAGRSSRRRRRRRRPRWCTTGVAADRPQRRGQAVATADGDDHAARRPCAASLVDVAVDHAVGAEAVARAAGRPAPRRWRPSGGGRRCSPSAIVRYALPSAT